MYDLVSYFTLFSYFFNIHYAKYISATKTKVSSERQVSFLSTISDHTIIISFNN